jgi:hypothetical protein
LDVDDVVWEPDAAVAEVDELRRGTVGAAGAEVVTGLAFVTGLVAGDGDVAAGGADDLDTYRTCDAAWVLT